MALQSNSRSSQRAPQAGPLATRLLSKASTHHEAGRLRDAERLYRRLLESDPFHAGAHYKLGLIANQNGEPDRAVPHLAAALKAQPDNPQHWLSLATTLLRASRLPDARAILTRFVEQGFLGAQIDTVKGHLVDMLFSEACQHYGAERLLEAEALLDTIILLDGSHSESIHLAGNIACKMGRLEQAYYLITTAVSLNDQSGAFHSNLGNVLCALGHLEQAQESYETAMRLKPEEAEVHSNLGVVFHKQGRVRDAIDEFHRALRLNPLYVNAYSNLGGVLKEAGRLEEAILSYDKALELDPNVAFIHSNRLFSKMYSADLSLPDILADAKAFGERFADPLLRDRAFSNIPDPTRKLRIGFVSADFRNHAVNHFFEPVISNFDKTQFETFAYSHTIAEDDVTVRLKTHFDHWCCIRGLTEATAADLVEADSIDILVDLSGHTAGNRLLMFARKPAPIQVTWLGYPGTTGMKAMDYRLTDAATEPEGMTDHLSVETLWRLPHMAACYQANPLSPAVIDHPPCEDNGYVTFGCFNRFTKITDPVLTAWGEILARVPESRLLLEVGGIEEPVFRAETEARFERLGLPVDRFLFEPRKPENQYVLYNRIDIALDPFPYNGGTTSLDTLWMGVPFIALEGAHCVSRLGSAFLTTVGLPELVAKTADDYVELASSLANDWYRLRALRHGLRGRMQRSPLMDHKMLADNMGAAFRGMWQIWVDKASDGMA